MIRFACGCVVGFVAALAWNRISRVSRELEVELQRMRNANDEFEAYVSEQWVEPDEDDAVIEHTAGRN